MKIIKFGILVLLIGILLFAIGVYKTNSQFKELPTIERVSAVKNLKAKAFKKTLTQQEANDLIGLIKDNYEGKPLKNVQGDLLLYLINNLK